jgi:hypothetical protein
VVAGLVCPAIRCAISIVPPEFMYSVTPAAPHQSRVEHIGRNMGQSRAVFSSETGAQRDRLEFLLALRKSFSVNS